MSLSQFTIYSSADSSAPVLSGSSGALITVLDAILINGYGSKAAAGWTRPVATASNITSYKNGGSQMSCVINDASPNATSLGKEAWITGWESVAGVGSPVGTGTGQFPTPAQLLTTGHAVIRKSTTNDGTARAWFALADLYSLYMLISTGDVASTYYSWFFGDVFSMKGNTDAYRCLLQARSAENSTTNTSGDVDQLSALSNAIVGCYMPRTYGGGGTSITCGRHGDSSKGSSSALVGSMQTPNGPDSAWWLSPVWVGENSISAVRGRMRGLYQMLHATASFADGQTFSGAGDFAGKTFQIFKAGPNSSMYVFETSATVETN